MEITIKQGNLQVLTTNSIIVPKGYETTIILDNEFEISVIFVDGKNQEIKKESIKNRGIRITLIAFNNSLGTSTINPIPIAKRNDKTVYMSICVYAINNVKILTYTILSEA